MLTDDEFQIQLHKHIVGKDKLGRPTLKWSFEFRGKRVVLTERQLFSQRSFRWVVFRTVYEFPPLRAQVNYEHWLGKILGNCIEDAAPPEVA